MEKTWRWFGQNDPVKLDHLKQIGVEGVVTSLYEKSSSEAWSSSEIKNVKNQIEQSGLKWSVVESLPVDEGIKTHAGDYDHLVTNYIESLKNLSENGIFTVCYNFMPAIDWVRTDISYKLPNGGEVMYFDYIRFIAFDVYILKRPGAKQDYREVEVEQAEKVFNLMTPEEAEKLAYNIVVYTQGFIHGNVTKGAVDYKCEFIKLIEKYKEIDKDQLRSNLTRFLNDIIPYAEKFGIKMCIHPDDPPISLLGLPRIVSTQDDLNRIFEQNTSLANGFTFCSGSLSARPDNNLPEILKSSVDRVHFVHLRNNRVYDNGNFHESGHIDGNVNLPELIRILLEEQLNREKAGRKDTQIPVRADHGIRMLDDFNRDAPPGYPLIGRLKGLMEIKGVEAGVQFMMESMK